MYSTPAFSATHELSYVLPSDPQTGMYSFVHGIGQSHTCVHLPSASHQAQPHAEPPPQQFLSPEPSGPPTTSMWLRAHESGHASRARVPSSDLTRQLPDFPGVIYNV